MMQSWIVGKLDFSLTKTNRLISEALCIVWSEYHNFFLLTLGIRFDTFNGLDLTFFYMTNKLVTTGIYKFRWSLFLFVHSY